jgi:putative spermidine/putrescine transport system ATP-binding protein
MRDGRFEQVGAAADVYEQPRTRFVAEFVGTSNVFSGAAARSVFGREITAAVRPERIRLVDGPPRPDEICVTGVVREVVYAGAESRVLVAADDDVMVTALVLNGAVQGGLPQRGAAVILGWPAAAVRELEP